MIILAIDPGNEESGWCLIEEETYKPTKIGKNKNTEIISAIHKQTSYDRMVVEMIASYGMSVGQTVFDTCVWIGRFIEATENPRKLVFRKDVKLNICGNARATDGNIRQALVDRFAYDRHKPKGGKGTIKDPGWFYGFRDDIWQAYALGITFIDFNKDKWDVND